MTGSEMLKNAFFRKTALERLFIDRFDSGFLCFEDFDSLQRIAIKHFRNSKFCSRDFCAVIFCFFKLVFICLEKFWNYLVLLAFDGRSQLYSQFFFLTSGLVCRSIFHFRLTYFRNNAYLQKNNIAYYWMHHYVVDKSKKILTGSGVWLPSWKMRKPLKWMFSHNG